MKKAKQNTTYVGLRMPSDLHERLQSLVRPGTSLTAVLLAACEAFVDPERAEKAEADLVRQLAAIERRLARQNRMGDVTAEVLLGLVRAFYLFAPVISKEDQPACSARGAERVERFLGGIEKSLRTGKPLLAELAEQVWAEGDFAALPASAKASPEVQG